MPTRSYYFPTDFRHLEEIAGCEVDGGLGDLLTHFRNKNVAPIYSEGALAIFLGISPKIIHSIRKSPQKHYRNFKLMKKSGEPRYISTPRTYLKVIQWWILDNVLSTNNFPEYVFGFVKGRSAVENANYHFGARHLLNLDIHNFFPSITLENVEDLFRSFGYSSDVSKMLADLCCKDGRLPQGAPTSPALSNFFFKGLDDELFNLSKRHGLKYSRYADDLSFSADKLIAVEFVEAVTCAVSRFGLSLNSAKTRFSGPGDRMEVTGVVINEVCQPSRQWRKNVRARVHKLGLSNRLTRKDINYLYSIRSMSVQYPNSKSVDKLASAAEELLDRKMSTVIGFGEQPVLPNGLTLRQAETLAALRPRISNLQIASEIGSTEGAVKSRLQEAYRKIGVSGRSDAFHWAQLNL